MLLFLAEIGRFVVYDYITNSDINIIVISIIKIIVAIGYMAQTSNNIILMLY